MRIKPTVKIVSGPLSLAPLVDVVFLLLIFFMISSSLVFWPGTKVETKVNLPRSRTNSMSAADKLIVTMTRSDLLFFNDSPVSWDDLELMLREAVRRSRLATAKRTSPDNGNDAVKMLRSPLVVLRADESIPYGKIIEVMSLARSLDLGVYLVTDQQPARKATPRILGE